jgi:hypothetical protein
MINTLSAGWGALRRRKKGFAWGTLILLFCCCALVAARAPAETPVSSLPLASKLTGGASCGSLADLLGGKRFAPQSVSNFYLNNYTN